MNTPTPTSGLLHDEERQDLRAGKLAALALPGKWTLHTLRHRFASKAYTVEHDLIAVQQLLGHSSVATTQRYVATDSERLRRAAAGAAA